MGAGAAAWVVGGKGGGLWLCWTDVDDSFLVTGTDYFAGPDPEAALASFFLAWGAFVIGGVSEGLAAAEAAAVIYCADDYLLVEVVAGLDAL